MDLSLSELETFLTLAKELHFGRTAQRLLRSQAAVTRQIKSLERWLGVELFRRSSRTVELTQAGRIFETGAAAATAMLDRARGDAQRAAAGQLGVVRLGCCRGPSEWLAPDVLGAFRKALPDVSVLFYEMTDADQIAALIDDALDIALTRTPFERTGLACVDVSTEPMAVVVPDDHWAAGRASLRLVDLRDERFILWRRSYSEYVFDRMIAVCSRDDFTIEPAIEVDNPHTALGLVRAGEGVTLLSYGRVRLKPSGIQYVPVSDLDLHLYLSSRMSRPGLTERAIEIVESVLDQIDLSPSSPSVTP